MQILLINEACASFSESKVEYNFDSVDLIVYDRERYLTKSPLITLIHVTVWYFQIYAIVILLEVYKRY
jgi:hypothetical protein